MINIHLLSKYSPDFVSYYMKQLSIKYFLMTHSEAKLFQFINQFHSNGYLGKNHQLNYSKLDLAYITPFIHFQNFYHFISSNSKIIQNNQLYFSSKYNKPVKEKKKEDINDKYLSNQMKSFSSSSSPSNQSKSPSKSYCATIKFHDKEIMSYCTTSVTDSNETIICFSIKDIILTYFPWITSEDFLHLCRLKQIIRYKPDKSTHSDLSLRLINMQQFEQYWTYFNEQFSPNSQFINETPLLINKSPSLINDNLSICSSEIIEQSSVNISSCDDLPQIESSSCKMDTDQSINDELISIETKSLLNELIERVEQQENSLENICHDELMITDVSDDKQEQIILPTIENKRLKRKRRLQKCPFVLKRRKQKQLKNQNQSWIHKYSIEPVSIVLHRVHLPII